MRKSRVAFLSSCNIPHSLPFSSVSSKWSQLKRCFSRRKYEILMQVIHFNLWKHSSESTEHGIGWLNSGSYDNALFLFISELKSHLLEWILEMLVLEHRLGDHLFCTSCCSVSSHNALCICITLILNKNNCKNTNNKSCSKV